MTLRLTAPPQLALDVRLPVGAHTALSVHVYSPRITTITFFRPQPRPGPHGARLGPGRLRPEE